MKYLKAPPDTLPSIRGGCQHLEIRAVDLSCADPSHRFGIQTAGTDAYMNLYADYFPADGKLGVYDLFHDSDGTQSEPVPVNNLTDTESEIILPLMLDAGPEECITEMRDNPKKSGGMMTFS